jgi:hypothetical protein
MVIALVLTELGRPAEALTMAEQEQEPFARLTALGYVNDCLGRRAESEASLQKLIAQFGDDAGYQIAAIYAGRRDNDNTFKWLESSYAKRDPGLLFVRVEPGFKPLHGDPRWRPFLKKMRLVD